VLNNIALDHKSMDELRALFSDFIGKARFAILNLDNEEVATMAKLQAKARIRTYSLHDHSADFVATHVVERADGIDFLVNAAGESVPVSLQVPGRHNASNALAALATANAAGIDLEKAAEAIGGFTGLRRRLEVVGTANGVTIIDDFGHNPDKIAASLATLHAFPGRLLIFFQPHGYGPLKQMGDELAQTFIRDMGKDDVLLMPDPVYFGGTVDRSVGSDSIVARVAATGRLATHLPSRDACGDRLIALATPGDRIIIMGARDDTLSLFANEVLQRLDV
jgi:UDP-N-acetylmuramate--alanine ligase